MRHVSNEEIFSIIRLIKNANAGDLYYEAYMWHLQKRGESFFDLYHFNRAWAEENNPRRILEIGTRTGISLCQLLSAHTNHSSIEKVVCCDLFNDGFISPGLVTYNLKLTGVPASVVDKVEFLVGDSKTKVLELTGQKFDYVLVDGAHDRETSKADLDNVYPLINQGGVIVFDDIGPDGCGLIDVWSAFKAEHESEFDWHEDLNGKGLGWCIKK